MKKHYLGLIFMSGIFTGLPGLSFGETNVFPESLPIIIQEISAIPVSGIVTGAEGEPLIGVNVQVKETNKGTATDLDGEFSLEDVDEQATLVFSYVGYQTQEIAVNGRTTIDVQMKTDAQLLDELMVVGYGTQKKSDVTGSVTSITTEKTEDIPNYNILQV